MEGEKGRFSRGAGDDEVHGESGDDSLSGGEGDDDLFGHSGNDRLGRRARPDSGDGGTGRDAYS